MRIVLLRHPETVANEVGYIYGKMDYPYTKKGDRQLKEAVTVSETFEFDSIITSPLGRAKRLAVAVAGIKGMTLEEAAALEEMNYGIFEGLTVEEAEAAYPHQMASFMSGDESFNIPEGESCSDFRARVIDFLDECLEKDRDLLLVSHGGVIRTAIEYLLEAEEGFSWLFDIGNASFTEIECSHGYGIIRNFRNLSI